MVEDGAVTVRVSAKDAGGGIDGIRLYAGGKAVGEDVRGLAVVATGPAGYQKEYRVFLEEGENVLHAVGFSRERSAGNPVEVKVAYRPPAIEKPRLFVLAVAADTYRNDRYNLNFALADSRGFVAALRVPAGRLFDSIFVEEVYEAELTRARVVAALQGIGKSAKPQDVFIFFFAGHGIAAEAEGENEFFFVLPGVTVMTDPERLRAEGIGSRELRDLVAAIPAKKQMLFVDACNSGAFIEGFAQRGAAEEMALAQLQRSAGIALYSASTESQLAGEVVELGHGFFTYALIKGIQGEAAAKDGRVTAASIKQYIDATVPDLAKKYRGSEQFPLARISGQDFPIGLR
jgi:uncharacterized caspase-like protein